MHTILKHDFSQELSEITDVLSTFSFTSEDILAGGGGKSGVTKLIEYPLNLRGWHEKTFDVKTTVDGQVNKAYTHGVDCYKNRVAFEIEWNNKDTFFDRDLSAFRLLHDINAISVGIIITRCDGLQDIFDLLGVGASYGTMTTHMNKLMRRLNGNISGGCPILVIGIGENQLDDSTGDWNTRMRAAAGPSIIEDFM